VDVVPAQWGLFRDDLDLEETAEENLKHHSDEPLHNDVNGER
jgi:hypothetical protein